MYEYIQFIISFIIVLTSVQGNEILSVLNLEL
jgi:hypothetical protein